MKTNKPRNRESRTKPIPTGVQRSHSAAPASRVP